MRTSPLMAPMLLLLLALSGCTQITGPEKVKALDNQFSPNSITIRENGKVKWTNDGQNQHTVTIHRKDDAMTQKLKDTNLDKGASTEYTFPDSGTFQVYCRNHSQGDLGDYSNGMVMTVTVSNSAI